MGVGGYSGPFFCETTVADSRLGWWEILLQGDWGMGSEAYLGAGILSAFVIPLAAIARLLSSMFIASIALTKGPQRFWPHSRDGCPSLCQNPPLWQRCERCNKALSLFWPPWLARTWQHGHHVTCALIGTSSLALWMMLGMSRWMQTKSAKLSKRSE